MRHAFIALFLCICSTIPMHARADESGDLNPEIAHNYQLQCAALKSGDRRAYSTLNAMLAPDYVAIAYDGTRQSRDEVINLEKYSDETRIERCDITIDALTQPDGDTIVVIETETTTSVYEGGGMRQDFSTVARSRDVWKLENGTWLFASSRVLGHLIKMDGQVVKDEGDYGG